MNYWLVLGFTAQAMFAARFLVQWIATERRKQSIVPIQFWYLSIAGAALLLVYSVHIKDPVFILGQSTGMIIYTRNLYFIRKGQRNAGNPPYETAAPTEPMAGDGSGHNA